MAAIIFRKGVFGTGGLSKVRPAAATYVPRESLDTTLYIGLEDNIGWLRTESDDPLIIE